jgi:hypothetical protein
MQSHHGWKKTGGSYSKSLSAINARPTSYNNGWKATGGRRPAAARSPSAGDGWGDAAEAQAPWNLTFDLRERETEWTEANKVRHAIVSAEQCPVVVVVQMPAAFTSRSTHPAGPSQPASQPSGAAVAPVAPVASVAPVALAIGTLRK